MNKIDLIKGIAKELYDSEEAYGEINAVATDNEYEDVAERIVNKFFIHGVSQRSELLELLTEIANNKTIYSNTRHKLIAKKLLSSNCG